MPLLYAAYCLILCQVVLFDQYIGVSSMAVEWTITGAGARFAAMIDPITGHLVAENSKITRAGVYQRDDGTWQLYPPDVFGERLAKMIEAAPLVVGHILGRVTNPVGSVGNVRLEPDGWITARVVITDADTIARALAGQVGLSLGYTADIAPDSGVYNGIAYTSRVAEITGVQHVAIVGAGRVDGAQLDERSNGLTTQQMANGADSSILIQTLTSQVGDLSKAVAEMARRQDEAQRTAAEAAAAEAARKGDAENAQRFDEASKSSYARGYADGKLYCEIKAALGDACPEGLDAAKQAAVAAAYPTVKLDGAALDSSVVALALAQLGAGRAPAIGGTGAAQRAEYMSGDDLAAQFATHRGGAR